MDPLFSTHRMKYPNLLFSFASQPQTTTPQSETPQHWASHGYQNCIRCLYLWTLEIGSTWKLWMPFSPFPHSHPQHNTQESKCVCIHMQTHTLTQIHKNLLMYKQDYNGEKNLFKKKKSLLLCRCCQLVIDVILVGGK